MAIAYTPPGVNVAETVNPSVSPLLAVPASICLVGLSQGYIQQTEQITLTGTTVTPLNNVPAGATVSAFVAVTDAIDPGTAPNTDGTYRLTTDYTVSTSAATVTRVGSGVIPDGRVVNVTYQYVPADYFKAIRLDDMSSVEARFGSSYDPTGTQINSQLSYAAGFAFENGAGSVVLQPLFRRTTANDPYSARVQATAPNFADPVTWQQTYYALRDIEDINVLVPVVGQNASINDAAYLTIAQTAQDHIKFMRDNQQYIILILGEDSTTGTTVAQKSTIQSHASTLQGRYNGLVSEQMVLVAPSKFTRTLPTNLAKTINLGGQYVGAAVAGMIAARVVSASLTRKQISGFRDVTDYRSVADMNADAQAGLMVVYQKGLQVKVRHSVTIDNTATSKRELSIVRAKHRMVESVRSTLEENVIGQVVADGNAPLYVASQVTSVLESLKTIGDLVDYAGVQARTLSLDPTTVEVRFSYKPAFPINYINIVFSLDLTSGEIETRTV